MEKEADLIAATYSGCVKGAIYLFDLLGRNSTTNPTTHPSDRDRVDCLTEFAESHLLEEII